MFIVYVFFFSKITVLRYEYFRNRQILSFEQYMVDICVYLVVEGVGGHAEEVGDGVVHVGAEGVDGVADAEVVMVSCCYLIL